jgi:hypothetical protein
MVSEYIRKSLKAFDFCHYRGRGKHRRHPFRFVQSVSGSRVAQMLSIPESHPGRALEAP